MELKITQEKVLAAAAKCSTAKAALETLFPEAFKEEEIDIKVRSGGDGNLYNKAGEVYGRMETGDYFFQVRSGGKYNEKGFFLNPKYHWTIVDESGVTRTLVPTRKKK